MSTPKYRKIAGTMALLGTLVLSAFDPAVGQTTTTIRIAADGLSASTGTGTIQQDPILSGAIQSSITVDPIIIQNPITTTPGTDVPPDPDAIPFISAITKISPDGTSASTYSSNSGVSSFSTTQYIVQYKKGAKKDLLPGSKRLRNFAKHPDLHVVDLPPGMSVKDAIKAHRKNPNVLYAEPDYIIQTSATLPTDPEWPRQWDMVKIGADIAWDTQTNASDVVVAVIDSGIYYPHPDLQGNLWVNPADGISNGFTCMGGPCVVGGLDDYGHGTHVAGAIGAAGNNATGIAGINWQVKLLSLKFTNANGQGLTSDAIHAFQKVLELKQQGVNIRVTNNSWGGAGNSQALKDAMAAVEAAGIVDVCASGNANTNVDVTPDYPASFDNRGIISVSATDGSDLAASFSNFGMANTDISAPGVSTLSTVPIGAASPTCVLCDPTGYRTLSGTSMAAPHVAGVVAALVHQHPELSPEQIRDIILDPASYDPTFNVKAQSSTTGGRLNMAKVLANARLAAPVVLNNFPSIAIDPPETAVDAGGFVQFAATPADPDISDLAGMRTAHAKQLPVLDNWLFGAMLGQLYPSPTGSATTFTAPSTARVSTVPFVSSVADNRGGGALGTAFVTTKASLTNGGAPVGTISVSNANPLVGEVITLTHGLTDPDAGQVLWGYSAFYQTTGNSTCCFSAGTTTMSFQTPRLVRLKAQTIDRELNVTESNSIVLRVGGATGEPPLAKAVLDKLSGPVPLTVNIDMSGSVAGSVGIKSYFYFCSNGQAPVASTSTGSCTFTTPGSRWVQLMVEDLNGQTDMTWAYVVATPASAGADVTPPTVAVTSPGEATNIGGTTTLTAAASDLSGIARVEFRLDSPTGTLLGSKGSAPFSFDWNTVGTTNGAHAIYAVAFDGAGNSAASAPRNVVVGDTVAPVVSLTSPVAGNVNGTVTLSASASDSAGIASVEYRLDSPTGTLIGSSTTGPDYTVSWNSTAFPGAHTIYAVARDTAGNVGISAAVAVTVIVDSTAPTVSIASPTGGSTVRGFTTIRANAADTSGVARVEYRIGGVNGTLLGASTVGPNFAFDWDTRPFNGSNQTLYARAIDTVGNAGNSVGVTVTVRSDTTTPTLSAITVTPDPTNGGVAVFDAPLNRLEVRGFVLLSTTASDASGIARVEYRLDSSTGPLLGTATVGSPYVVSWNSTTVTLGNHTLYARAFDRVGNVRTSAGLAIVVRAADVILPVVSITSPTDGATVQNTVTLTASASDASGIASVEYRLDSPTGTVIGSSTTAPYTVSWNSAAVAAGAHTIYARATDGAGNVATSAAVGITVNAGDTTLPVVSISSPTAGSSVTGTVTLTASASDANGITQVQYRLDSPTGTVIGSSATAPYSVSWNTTTTTVGAHTLYAVATDGNGNVGTSAAVSVNVTAPTGNVLPTGAFSFPSANGTRFTANFTATGTAADSDGTVATVEYRLDTGAWATATGTTNWSAPITVTTLTRGTHTISVRITDNAGGVTTISRTFSKR